VQSWKGENSETKNHSMRPGILKKKSYFHFLVEYHLFGQPSYDQMLSLRLRLNKQ